VREGPVSELRISNGEGKEGDDLWALVQASRGISLTELRVMTE